MTIEQQALLELVCAGATGMCDHCEALRKADWNELICLISQHGVACLAMHGLEIVHKHGICLFPTEAKLQLYVRSQQAMKIAREKRDISSDFAELVKPLRVVALKGVDYARFWPQKEWREFGDLDCCLAEGCGSDLDKKAVEAGCIFEEGDTKHTHLFYKNLMIENHHRFTGAANIREVRMLENELVKAFGREFSLIEGTALLSPNVNFTALYMITHAQSHFFYEGITLRMILDWYFFLIKEEGNVDWHSVNNMMKRTRLLPFAVLLTQFCKKHFGLQQQMTHIDTDKVYAGLLEKFEEDLFAEQYNDHDRRWWMMVARMLHRYKRMWRFRELMRMSVGKAIWRTIAFCSFQHRKPKL